MMRVAIYARRSTEEHQEASLDVQLGEARRYIARKGWVLLEEHIYVDDAVSRAEFKKRPALIAMLNAAKRGLFDVVVVRDETRLGGDMNRLGLLIQDLLDTGVRLHYYFTDEEVTTVGALGKFLVMVRGFTAELEREKIAQRTREHLMTKARRGLNVGGRVFGYDNVEVKAGGRRTHVDYRVNDEQAKVVREIFESYAGGTGLRGTAKLLNDRRVPSPSAGTRGTGTWSSGCIRAILFNERYRGILIWGREGKAYKGGTRVRVHHAPSEWIKTERPELEIISEALWLAVQTRRDKHQSITKRNGAKGPRPRYLLSGFSKCSECGGPMQVANSKAGTETIKVYVCAWHRGRGKNVCTNSWRRPVDVVDQAVINWLNENILREQLVIETLKEVRRRLSMRVETTSSELPALEEQIRSVKAEIDRFVVALASTDSRPDAIVRAIADREKRLVRLNDQLRSLRTAPTVLDAEVAALEDEARARLADLRNVLTRNPEEARRAIAAFLDGPLTFKPLAMPDGARRFEITGNVGGLSLFTTEQIPLGSQRNLDFFPRRGRPPQSPSGAVRSGPA